MFFVILARNDDTGVTTLDGRNHDVTDGFFLIEVHIEPDSDDGIAETEHLLELALQFFAQNFFLGSGMLDLCGFDFVEAHCLFIFNDADQVAGFGVRNPDVLWA